MPQARKTAAIADAIQVGATWPTYTWRKGKADGTDDNHYWLSIGSASEPLDVENDALIEIDPETKLVRFHGKTQLLESISFEDNSLEGGCLVDGSITGSKLEPGIEIDGSIARLTNPQSIDGITFDGSEPVIHFAQCTTQGSTTRKAVTVTNWSQTVGGFVLVQFTNTNTATNPTLNINGTGELPIYYQSTNVQSDKLVSGRVYMFVYTGNSFDVVGDIAPDVQDESVRMVPAETSAASLKFIVTPNTQQAVGSVNFVNDNALSYNCSTKTLNVSTINSSTTGDWSQINQQTAVINNTGTTGVRGLASCITTDGVYTISGTNNGLVASFTSNDDVTDQATTPTHLVNLLDRSGNATFPGRIVAPNFIGTASVADRANHDGDGNTITSTYLTVVNFDNTIANYVPSSGGTFAGIVRVPAISTETNTQVSTVGYTDKLVSDSINDLRQEIIGTAGDFDTIAEISTQVTNNTNAINELNDRADGLVSFVESQTLTSTEKNTATTNIGAVSTSGGTVDGSLTVNQQLIVNGGFTNSNPDIVAGTNPSATERVSYNLTGRDSTNVIGELTTTVSTNGTTTTSIVATSNSNSARYGALSVAVSSNGTVTTSAPNPPTNDDSTKIATTSWVNDAVATAVAEGAAPIASRTYTSQTASAGNHAGGLKYFGQIVPADYNQPWSATFTIIVTTPYTGLNQSAQCHLYGVGSQFSYHYDVICNSTQIAFDGLSFVPCNSSNVSTGHRFGISIGTATNPTNTGYARTINVQLNEVSNCTGSLLNSIATSVSSSTHGSEAYTSTRSSGTYVMSNINYGDRLAIWNRLPVASGTVRSGSLVGETNGGAIVSLTNSSGAFTSTAIRPDTLMVYTGNNLSGNTTGQPGTLWKSIAFTGSAGYGSNTNYSANTAIYLRGTLNHDTWLFTGNAVVTSLPTSNDGYQYVLIGYSGTSGTNQVFLIDNHPIYQYVPSVGRAVPISPKPIVSTPSSSSNDTTIATTAFVKTVANSISQQALVNPVIDTDYDDGTDVIINAPAGQLDRGNATKNFAQTIVFRDGTTLDDDYVSSALSYVQQITTTNTSQLNLLSIKPDIANDATSVGLNIGYSKSGSTWSPFIRLTTSPATNSDDNSVATTGWVNDKINASATTYGRCTTAAGTAAKTVSISGFTRSTGRRVLVTFTNGCTVANPTLNVQSTGAAAIRYLNANLRANDIVAGGTIEFVFDGTYWQVIGALPNRYATEANPTVSGTLTIN